MKGPEDTIVAVSTATGPAERGVVRLSGPLATAAVSDRFTPQAGHAEGWRRTYQVTAGAYRTDCPPVPVPCLLYVMRAPHSYTREDVVELHVPGAPAVLDLLVDDLLQRRRCGVRMAEPGEFTRRAFMNGRIDLAQAEAVLGVIRARGQSELLAAASQLQGGTGRQCSELLAETVELRVQAEAALDFAPNGIELMGRQTLLDRCRQVRRRAEERMGKGRSELASCDGVSVVLCGLPNAGKSSLLNAMLGEERALVHARPGTTRDAVSGRMEVRGVKFRVSDTAGLLDSADEADAQAVDRARRSAGASRLVVLVLDASEPLAGALPHVADAVGRHALLCVLNKSDRPQRVTPADLREGGFCGRIVRTSALTGQGVEELKEVIGRVVFEGKVDMSAADCAFSARQREALLRAVEEIGQAEQALEADVGYEFAAVNLREAADALREVTGESVSADVLDGIFSRFCIGK